MGYGKESALKGKGPKKAPTPYQLLGDCDATQEDEKPTWARIDEVAVLDAITAATGGGAIISFSCTKDGNLLKIGLWQNGEPWSWFGHNVEKIEAKLGQIVTQYKQSDKEL